MFWFKKSPDVIEHKKSEWMYRYVCICCNIEYTKLRTLCENCGCENTIQKQIVKYEWDENITKKKRLDCWDMCYEPDNKWERSYSSNVKMIIKPEGCQKDK